MLIQEPIRIELPEIFNMKTVNSWLFKDPEPTLIDCGELTDQSYAALETGLKANGLTVKDIKRIIITHAHVDHIGMANRIVQESGAMVYLSEYAYDWGEHVETKWPVRTSMIEDTLKNLLHPDSDLIKMLQMGSAAFSQMLNYWEAIPGDHVREFKSADGINIGGKKWEVIYAPGHSSSQTCFYEPESKYLMSADMLLNIAPTPVIEADPFNPSVRMKGLAIMMHSYQRFREMDISIAFPGHYHPFSNIREVIDHQVNRIQNRTAQCYQFIKDGHHSFSELTLKMYPSRMSFPAIAMMIGYLDLLEDQGKIKCHKEAGIFEFHPQS